jgi:hypothetical protein
MACHNKYSGRGIPRVEVKSIKNLATMNEKLDTVTHSSDEALEEGSAETVLMSFEEKTDAEKKLVWKIDLYLMPTIWILYCFSYMVCRSNSPQRKNRTSPTNSPHRTAQPSATPKSPAWMCTSISRPTTTPSP